MDEELLENSTVALIRHRLGDKHPDSDCYRLAQEDAKAVLRVAIKACAQIAHSMPEDDLTAYDMASAIEYKIRALLD